MKPPLRQFIRDWVPPALRRLTRRFSVQHMYSGDYGTWAGARANSLGYDAAAIFDRTRAAARKVRDGQAAWERDSVTFDESAAHWPVLACLLYVTALRKGRLCVLDLGGSFGSTWGQHRAWFDRSDIQWRVVEQPHIVAAGRAEFTRGPLRFYETMDAACAEGVPDVILLSSVLPYLESPHSLLADIARQGFRHVIVDRTGFVRRGTDRLTVQHVPPEIYAASYPCWFFDRAALLRPFAANWRVVAEWPTDDEADIDAAHGGFLLEKTTP